MIPFFAFVSFRNRRNRSFRLWIPLFLVWLLLLPVAILLLPLFFVLCAAEKVNAFQARAIFWQILTGLKGTHVEVAEGQASVLIHTF